MCQTENVLVHVVAPNLARSPGQTSSFCPDNVRGYDRQSQDLGFYERGATVHPDCAPKEHLLNGPSTIEPRAFQEVFKSKSFLLVNRIAGETRSRSFWTRRDPVRMGDIVFVFFAEPT